METQPPLRIYFCDLKCFSSIGNNLFRQDRPGLSSAFRGLALANQAILGLDGLDPVKVHDLKLLSVKSQLALGSKLKF